MSGQRRPPGPTIHVKRAMPTGCGVPLKRRKLEHAKNAPEELQRSPTKAIPVKREPSPTPPPSLTPRTSGTVRINIPADCCKNVLGWKERRDKWVGEETLKLKCLGLTVSKRLIREDGLALDWVSRVPVCPLTLRPPTQVMPNAQIHQPQRAPSKQLPVDLLGHALNDQLSSSHPPRTSGPKPSAYQIAAPRHNGRKSLPQPPDGEARVISDFTVVGAATRKEREAPGSARAAPSALDDTIQWEHRKLLPPDLRPSTQFRCANKEGARDRKARRLVWITKEIEKVEGYTGEKVGGFRYDGDDVIISLSKALYYARRRQELERKILSNPPQLDYSQPRASYTPPTGPRPTRVTSPSTIVPQENCTEDLHSRASVNLGSGAAAGGTSTATADVPVPPSKNSMVVKSASSPGEASTLTTRVLDQTSALITPTVRDSEVVIQARGLGFLERYLQLFDSDRDALSLAYTPNATFSLTEEKFDKSTGMQRSYFVSKATTSSYLPAAIAGQLPQINKTGRSAIVETLKKIRSDRHHSPSADITYNIATLDDMSTGGLLLTCEGALIPVDPTIQIQRHQWHFSRIFVLKQSDEDCRQSWPLQIAAERLTILRKMK